MSTGNSKQTASLPHWPSSVSWSCGWRQAGSVPQLWLRIQIRHAAVTRAALPLCQGGLGHECKMTPHELECQRKTKAEQEQTETNRRDIEKQVILQRHEGGN